MAFLHIVDHNTEQVLLPGLVKVHTLNDHFVEQDAW